MTNFLKGICYDAFSPEYNPSTANNTSLFHGSDAAASHMRPLWGKSIDGIWYKEPDAGYRDDLGRLKQIGVNLVRLYDWDPANNHMPFLDYCYVLGIKVLVPVSNYFLGAFGTAPGMVESINSLIKSFSDEDNNDYHPAIYGITIGNEIDINPAISEEYVLKFTQEWVKLEPRYHRKVPIGHPISFATHGEKHPCFNFWDRFLPTLLANESLKDRLMLCPNSYNEANYLFGQWKFGSWEKLKNGWIDSVFARYNLPVLFCEIGADRLTRSDYLQIIREQITSAQFIGGDPNGKLLGVCHFQFMDKPWMRGTSEGSFGIVSNDMDNKIAEHYFPEHNETLHVHGLKENPSYAVLRNAYLKN